MLRIGGVVSTGAKVGARLRDARLRAGLHLKAVAPAVGVSVSGLGKLETGAVKMTVDRLVAICEVLGIDPGQVIADSAAPTVRPNDERALLSAYWRGGYIGLAQYCLSQIRKAEQ